MWIVTSLFFNTKNEGLRAATRISRKDWVFIGIVYSPAIGKRASPCKPYSLSWISLSCVVASAQMLACEATIRMVLGTILACGTQIFLLQACVLPRVANLSTIWRVNILDYYHSLWKFRCFHVSNRGFLFIVKKNRLKNLLCLKKLAESGTSNTPVDGHLRNVCGKS